IAKTIRAVDRVLVTPSGRAGEPHGVPVVGRGRILPQLETYEPQRWIDHKYGLMAGVFPLVVDTHMLGSDVIVEITMDSGTGTNELLVEHISPAQRLAARQRILLSASAVTGIVLAGIAAVIWLRRRR